MKNTQSLATMPTFGLFEMQGGAAQLHGSLKSWETKDGNLVYYKDDPTGYTISVERLLQADGYADSTEERRLTLFVLKLVLACNSSSRIKQAVFNMHFEDLPQKGKKKANTDKKVKPVIQAWAPFGEMVKTGQVDVDYENTKRANFELGSEGGGVVGKGSAGMESKIKWTEKYWESAHSYPTFGKDHTRTGVRWVLNANEKATQGLPPNIMVGILLSRQSDEPYLVNFDIKVTGRLLKDLLTGIEKILGRNPEVTKPYRVVPSKEAIALHTGLNMLEKVNLKSMLELKGRGDNLILVWDDEKTDAVEKKKTEKSEDTVGTERVEPPSVTK
jgi:hypothetical protein